MEVIRYLTAGEYRRVYGTWIRLENPRGRRVLPRVHDRPRDCPIRKAPPDTVLDGNEIAYARLKSAGWKMIKDVEHRFGDLTREEETQLQRLLKGDNRNVF